MKKVLKESFTKLIRASGNHRDEPKLLVAVREGSESRVQLELHKPETDVDAVHPTKGTTALHIAAGKANLAVVKLLLSRDASVEIVDADRGETALHTLARMAAGHKDACAVAKALLDKRADPYTRRAIDHKLPSDLCKGHRDLRNLLFNAEREWQRLAKSTTMAQAARTAENRRAIEAEDTAGQEVLIITDMPNLYPVMQSAGTTELLIPFIRSLQSREQYSAFSLAYALRDRNGSDVDELGRLIIEAMLDDSTSFHISEGAQSSHPIAVARPSMLLNIVSSALGQGYEDHLNYLEGLIMTEHRGELALLNVLAEALNHDKKEVLAWIKRKKFVGSLTSPKDHLSVIGKLATGSGKEAFFKSYIGVQKLNKLFMRQAEENDRAFFDSFLLQSNLFMEVLGNGQDFRRFWSSNQSEFFLGLLQPQHWLALLHKHAHDRHARWLCKQGAIHRCLLLDSAFSIQQLGVNITSEKLATVCWRGMTVLETACFRKNIRVVRELCLIDSTLLTDSAALTLTTDFEMLLLLNCLWEGREDGDRRAAHDLACSRAPEDTIMKACECMILEEKHLFEKDEVNPVSLAVQYGRNRVLKHYLSINPKLASVGEPSPLWHATITGNKVAVKALLRVLKPEDVNRAAPDGTTPLLVAWVKEWWEIYRCIEKRIPDSVSDDSIGASTALDRTRQMPDHSFPRQSNQHRDRHAPALRPLEMREPNICALSRMFPMHRESEDSPEWTSLYRESSSIVVAEVRKQHLLQVCGLKSKISPMELFSTILGCRGHKESDSSEFSCPIIRALTQFLLLLESQVRSDDKKLNALGLEFSVIGSIVEGSRMGLGIEMDANILFDKLKAHPFCMSDTSHSLGLSSDGYNFFEKNDLLEFITSNEGSHKLNYLALMKHLLYALKDAIAKMDLPSELEVGMTNDAFHGQECDECDNNIPDDFEANGSIQAPTYHCAHCLPVVAMTKLGPCLQLLYKGQVVTIDLVPLLPHSEEPLKLIHQMVTTLYKEKSPGWEKTLKHYIDRDRFLYGQPREEKQTLVALKLQHFGTHNNYIIRGTQDIDVGQLSEKPNLLEAYIALKVARDVLHVNCKSYMLKKTLLKASMVRYLEKSPTSLQLFYEALIQPELRPIFESHIDLELTQKKINEQETDIIIYRNLPTSSPVLV